MKTTRIIFAFFFLAVFSGEAASELMIGTAVNSSSNMLLRPHGKSGTIATLYGKAGFSLGKAAFLYNFNGGMIEHYRGMQFQAHSLAMSYLLIDADTFAWNAEIEGSIGRYGKVTSLDRFSHVRLSSNLKTYFSDALLFRWLGSAGRRSYGTYDRESYDEVSTIYRLDRFFPRGLTLRGQIDAGWRRYYEQTEKPSTYIIGFSGRTAKSIRPGWGVMLEAFTRRMRESASQDSSRVFNRVFLDDIYKYSSTGLMAGTTVLIRRVNSIQLRLYYSERKYSDSQTSFFWYLPPEGWKEYESAAFLTVKYRLPFLPEWMHTVFEMYHTDVNASEDKFSYSSSGVTFRYEIY